MTIIDVPPKPEPPAPEPWTLSAILFCLGSVALATPWIGGWYTIPWDAKAGAYPQFAFLARSIAAGESPFWAPGVFAGHPQIADPQSLIFSPPFLLVAALMREPGFVALDATVFAMLTLAGLSLFVFFRDRRWRPEGALVAAFAFSFGCSNAWRVQHVTEVLSLCWFAITLTLLARALDRSSWRYGFAAGVVAGFMVLGRDQIALLCVYLLVLFVAWHLLSGFFMAMLRAALAPLAAGLVGGLLVVTVPLALTISLAAQSNRPAIDFASAARGSLSPLTFLSAFVSNLYGVDGPLADFWGPPASMIWGDNDFVLARNMGAVYFGAIALVAILVVGIGRGVALRGEAAFFTLAAVLMGAYAVGSHTPFFAAVYKLPGVDLYRRPADATFPLGAMLAILAGYCVHVLASDDDAPRGRIGKFFATHGYIIGLLLVVAGFVASELVAWSKGRLAQASEPLALAAASLIAAAVALVLARFNARHRPALSLALLAAVSTADLAVSNKPNESTALPPATYDALRFGTHNETIALIRTKLAEHAAPDRRDRVELAAVGYEWPNAGLVHGFDHDLGFNPVRLKLFVDATNAGDQIAIPQQRVFSPLYAGFRSPLADLLGVRLVVSAHPLAEMDKSFRPEDLPLVARTKDGYVHENPRALPRVLFATSARGADFDAMIREGGWPDVDFRRVVLLQGDADATLRPPGSARIRFYRNTEVVVEAESPEGGWVVLNDVFHPWWKADVDGAPAPILRANVMFRAVAVPAGKHVVTFRFAPFSGVLADFTGR